MDKNKLIILGLIIVIIALLIVIGAMMLMPAKEASKLTVTGENTIYKEDSVEIRLTDLNGNAISDETVNITITDNDKTSEYYSVVTDEKGIAKLKVDNDEGEYAIYYAFGGNENFTGSNATQNLKIKEEVVHETSSSNSYSSSSSASSSDSSDYSGPAVDSSGITREEAEEYGYTYTPEHGGHYIGSHDAWDEEAGVYHD